MCLLNIVRSYHCIDLWNHNFVNFQKICCFTGSIAAARNFKLDNFLCCVQLVFKGLQFDNWTKIISRFAFTSQIFLLCYEIVKINFQGKIVSSDRSKFGILLPTKILQLDRIFILDQLNAFIIFGVSVEFAQFCA